jgi:hypothetical protein
MRRGSEIEQSLIVIFPPFLFVYSTYIIGFTKKQKGCKNHKHPILYTLMLDLQMLLKTQNII